MPIAEGKQIWFNGNNFIREVQDVRAEWIRQESEVSHPPAHLQHRGSRESVCSISPAQIAEMNEERRSDPQPERWRSSHSPDPWKCFELKVVGGVDGTRASQRREPLTA